MQLSKQKSKISFKRLKYKEKTVQIKVKNQKKNKKYKDKTLIRMSSFLGQRYNTYLMKFLGKVSLVV
jgi:hypothetical protein